MRYSFHPEAEAELVEAVAYYEAREEGLGHALAVEVYATIQRILAHPQAWPILEKQIRRALVRRFPYGVLYTQEDDEIFVVAVMHLHREPGYWKPRAE